MSEAVRIIKKYPNRRLYDTTTSIYITLADVKKLVLENIDFKVEDAKSKDDLTRSILLQIILEEEGGDGVPMFSSDVLSKIIRFYGNAMQGFMGGYLEKNIQSLVDIQGKLGVQPNGLTPEMWTQFMALQAPALQGMLGGNLQQSKDMLAQMQEQIMKQTGQVLGAFGIKS